MTRIVPVLARALPAALLPLLVVACSGPHPEDAPEERSVSAQVIAPPASERVVIDLSAGMPGQLPVVEDRRHHRRGDRGQLHHAGGHRGRQRRAIHRRGQQRGRPGGQQRRHLTVTGGTTGTLLSQGRPATASSTQDPFVAASAVDGDAGTRWASAFTNTEWIYVDLGATATIRPGLPGFNIITP